MITKELLQDYFHADFVSIGSLINDVLVPIFGDADPGYTEITATETLREKARNANILRIKHAATLSADGFEIKVFDVILDDNCHIHRSRRHIQTMIRQYIGHFEGALIAFHYANPADRSWRLSYLEKRANNTDSTSAKRYTYLCGKDYPCRTIAERFALLASQEKNAKNIDAAFSVEALSDEFFAEYKKQYTAFCDYIVANRNDATKFGPEFATCEDKFIRDYVKKMMGRLTFLHFLQKKGWLGQPRSKEGWGAGNVNFMRDLFAKATEEQKDNFLDEVLEPLFFDCLNDKREGDFFDTGVPGIRIVKIPYLNGGLFEKDEIDKPRSQFPKEMFQNLLDFYGQFNFTIDESDPLDTEVGVDPEMLGKIFENLLEDNKDKGAFYTPKEIVQYMCRESLIAYLTTKSVESNNGKFPREQVETKVRELLTNPHEIVPKMTAEQLEKFGKAIREVKICDPAVGSGAFPMGLLNELVRCRVSIHAWAKDEKGNLLDGDYAELKRDIIQNNIYGVDIEKGAIDIARLRFWLSIVVDEETPKALPNFDYKFMVGNSLIPTFDGEYINLDTKGQKHTNTIKMNEKKQELLRLKRRYYDASGDDKLQLGIEIKDTILQLVSLQLGYELKSWAASHVEQGSLFPQPQQMTIQEIVSQLPPERQRIVDLGKQLRTCLSDTSISLVERARTDIQFFDWRMMFTEVFDRENGGFDIVIGNPPYIKEYTNRAAFDGFREVSPYYMGKMDLWYGFACHGIDFLRKNGALCFIAQNNWTTNAGAKLMRKKIMDDSRILQMLDFNTYMVFENADIQTMIMLFQHDADTDDYISDYRVLQSGATKADMIALLNYEKTDFTIYRTPTFNRDSHRGKLITFSDNESLLAHVARDKAYLTDDEVAQGIVFPQDFLNRKGAEKLNGNHMIGEGIFGLSSQELSHLELSQTEKKLIKPYFTTDQISRYYTTEKNNLWLIYTGSSYKDEHSMDCYPKLKKHLDQFVDIITSDNKPYGLHRARKEQFFQNEKILSLRKCVGRPMFSYSDFDCYVTQTFFIIQSSRWNLKCLTGILNSKLIAFWLRHKGKMQGDNYQVDKEPLQNIPLPLNIMEDYQAPIISLVDRILAAKQSDPSADTSALENQIDELVYDLYGLTEPEKEIIRKG